MVEGRVQEYLIICVDAEMAAARYRVSDHLDWRARPCVRAAGERGIMAAGAGGGCGLCTRWAVFKKFSRRSRDDPLGQIPSKLS